MRSAPPQAIHERDRPGSQRSRAGDDSDRRTQALTAENQRLRDALGAIAVGSHDRFAHDVATEALRG